MKKISALLLALVLSLCACSATPTQSEAPGPEVSQGPTWQEQYDLGIRYLSEGNYEAAIIAFTAAIEIDPKQVLAYVGRGDAYIGSGETEANLAAAKADYEKGIELDETSAEAYLGLSDVYVRQGDYEKALEILQEGLGKTQNDQRIAEKASQIELQLEEIQAEQHKDDGQMAVLVRQTMTLYNSARDPDKSNDEWYTTFEYDGQGYLVLAEEWGRWSDGSSYLECSHSWTPDSDTGLWIYTYRRGNSVHSAKEGHKPGEISRYTSGIRDNVCMTCDPFPSNRPDIILNPAYEEGGTDRIDWYSANYTYDENGNAVRIESHSIDGVLLGLCDLEYSVIDVGTN